MARSIAAELAALKRDLAQVKKGQRYAHGGSIEDAALEVRDDGGSLRAIVGQQADGTTAVNVVNGPPPPQPSAPVVVSVLGGVTVSWDGTFADGSVLPLDWARVEVHASILASYEPVPATLQGTIETAQGATVVVPCDTPVYVRLVARNTSGTASTPSDTVGPYGPTPVVADDIVDGIVTTVKLADDAVTAAKVAVGAIGTDALAVGVGNLAPDPSFEGALTAQAIAGHADWTQTTPGNNSATALHVDCTSGATTWKNIELARYPVLPGERHYLAIDFKTSAAFNGTGVKLMFRYEDGAGGVLGYGVADKTFTPGAGWDRATAQVQAPTNTATAVLLVEASACTAGEVWFDNAEVSTLVVGGKVAAGSITATEIAALTIQAANIAADAIAAGKIAADAVTAREIAALAVTAAEIAANTITAGKLAAGAVDATALAADAITGKTITGGTITGSVIQTAASGQRITLNATGDGRILVYDASNNLAYAIDPALPGATAGVAGNPQVKVGTTGGAGYVDFPSNRSIENQVARLVMGVVNSGLANESSTLQVQGPSVTGANDRMVLRLNSQANNGTSDASAYLTHDDGAGTLTTILQATLASFFLDGPRLIVTPDPSASSALTVTADASHTGAVALMAKGSTTLLTLTNDGRLQLTGANSSSSALFINADTAHTGNLLRAQLNSVDRFTVDKDGNATVVGSLTVNGVGNRQAKRRTTDATPKASTTTVTADSQITFTVDANATYVIDGFLKYSGPGDFQMGWSIPSGALGEWQGIGNGTTVISSTAAHAIQEDVVTSWGYTMRTESTDIAATRTYGGIGSTAFGVQVRGTLRVQATGGTFALTWAQGTSNATGTILYTDSYIRLEKVT